MGHFGESENNGKNGVIAIHVREVSNKIHRNEFPRFRRNW
jgi:hypothetical protein